MDQIILWGFNIHAWITIAVVLVTFSTLLFTKLRSDVVFMGAVGVLYITGVLDADGAFAGFSSESVVIVGVLFVVVAGLMHTGVLQWISKNMLGQPKSYPSAVVRLMLPVAALSSVLSNTAVVALFVGIVKMWAKILSLLQCAFLAAGAMLLLRCCNAEQAMKAVNWSVLMVFACSVALGTAIQNTGIAEQLARAIMTACGDHPLIVMTSICLVGTFITEFISNTAAGAMFFPIMYEAAENMGYEPYPFLIALMISVSSSFATPIGSTTHMMVYGPGGYHFSDFMRIGLLMNFIILAANIFIVNIVYPLTPL